VRIKTFRRQRAARLPVMQTLLLLGAASLSASVSAGTSVKGAWVDGASRKQTFSRILVVGISPNVDQRCPFERALVARLKNESTFAVASCDVVAQKNPLTRESIEGAVASQKADAVIATSLISKAWSVTEGNGNDTASVSAGNPDSSKLWKALTHAEEPTMPPNKPPLPDKEIDIFKRWIAGGLLENSGSKAIAANKPTVDLALKAGAVGKPLAVVEPGDEVGGCQDHRAPFLLDPHFLLVLEVDVAAPTEQDQCHVERQRRAGDADFAAEILTGKAQIVEEGVAVPDQEQDGSDEDGKDNGIAARADKARARRRRPDSRGLRLRHATELSDHA